MNCRFLIIFIFLWMVAFGRAQDKAATPKPENPKVLIFKSDAKQPDGVSEAGAAVGNVVVRTPQADPMLDGPAQIVATFFLALQDGKVDEGYATLTKDSKIAEKPEELKQLKAKTREAIEVFGNIAGYDFVESRAVGLRLVRATYISQGKVFPLRWRFYFYKPEDSWRLIDMRVDDKLTGIFDELEEAKSDQKIGAGAQP